MYIMYNVNTETVSGQYDLVELDTCNESSDDSQAHHFIELDTCSEGSEEEVDSEEGDGVVAPPSTVPAIFNCCTSRCTAQFSVLEIEKLKAIYNRKTHTQQKQWILELLQLSVNASDTNEMKRFSDVKMLILNGKRCCIRQLSYTCWVHLE